MSTMDGHDHHVNANIGINDCPQSHQTSFDRGEFCVEIYKAEGIRGDEMYGVGRADPYLKIKHGTPTKRVTLFSKPHQDAGSNPEFNTRFTFPLRNGGTPHHNIIEIEIRNKNTHTGFARGDNCLGHLRIGGLSAWIKKHPHDNTPASWYPIFYKHRRRTRDQTEERGRILVKFSFSKIPDHVFAHGQRTQPRADKFEPDSRLSQTVGLYQRVEGKKLSSFLGVIGALMEISQTMIMLL